MAPQGFGQGVFVGFPYQAADYIPSKYYTREYYPPDISSITYTLGKYFKYGLTLGLIYTVEHACKVSVLSNEN